MVNLKGCPQVEEVAVEKERDRGGKKVRERERWVERSGCALCMSIVNSVAGHKNRKRCFLRMLPWPGLLYAVP